MSEHLSEVKTPISNLMRQMSPIIDDIIAGRMCDAVCRDYAIHGSVYGFIRKSLGLKRKSGGIKMAESNIRAVFDYSLEHTINETAEHFKISKSTVSKYIRLACGAKR